jgi:hypothetical protein
VLRDAIIEEVRQVRHKIETDCEDNPQKLYEHIQRVQEKYRNRLVKRGPKPALKKRKVGKGSSGGR